MKVSIKLGNSETMFGTANEDASFSVAWTALIIIRKKCEKNNHKKQLLFLVFEQ